MSLSPSSNIFIQNIIILHKKDISAKQFSKQVKDLIDDYIDQAKEADILPLNPLSTADQED